MKTKTSENLHVFRGFCLLFMIKYNEKAIKTGGLRHDTVSEEKSDAWRQQ
jgi:hypothetical protein